jgi:hypothetical protein
MDSAMFDPDYFKKYPPFVQWKSKCCNAEQYVKQSDYYSGYPSCMKCGKLIPDKDLRAEQRAMERWYKKHPRKEYDCDKLYEKKGI